MAKEIQKEWKPESGDYIAWISHPLVRLLGGKAYDAWRLLYPNQETMQYSLVHQNSLRKHPWLPRQDQLQKIYSPQTLNELVSYFERFCFKGYRNPRSMNPIVLFDSMEQLWLAFTMFQKFGKRWDGEKWEKSTSSD